MIGQRSEECNVEYRGNKIACVHHGEFSYPSGYRESTDCVEFQCGRAGMVEVEISDLPVDNLKYLYRKVRKTNNSILRDGGEPRKSDLVSRLKKEMDNRSISVPNTSLTHKVVMQKDQAMESEIPAIIKIGEAVGDYEFGTHPSEMVWSVLTTEEEAEKIQNKYDDVKVLPVTVDTKS